MQFAVNFGPVLLNRCSKYCSWIGPKLHSSSSCYSSLSGAGQTVEGVVKWMGQHAPVFAVKGNEITVLHEPEQFFNSLKVQSLHFVVRKNWKYFNISDILWRDRTMSATLKKGLCWLHFTWVLGTRSNNLWVNSVILATIDQPINQSVEQPTYQFINLQYIWFVKLTSSAQYQSIIR